MRAPKSPANEFSSPPPGLGNFRIRPCTWFARCNLIWLPLGKIDTTFQHITFLNKNKCVLCNEMIPGTKMKNQRLPTLSPHIDFVSCHTLLRTLHICFARSNDTFWYELLNCTMLIMKPEDNKCTCCKYFN